MIITFPKRTRLFILMWIIICIVSSLILYNTNDAIGYLFVFFLLAFGVSFPSFIDYKKMFKTNSWVKDTGTILDITIKSHIEFGRDSVNPPVYFPLITYKYSYNGIKYKSQNFSLVENDYRYIFESDVKNLIKEFSLDSKVEIWINPNNPSQTFIKKKISKEILFNNIAYNILSGILVMLGMYIFMYYK